MSWLVSNWQTVAIAVLSVAEIIALFVPGAQGTVKTIATSLAGAGVKDPGIGGL